MSHSGLYIDISIYRLKSAENSVFVPKIPVFFVVEGFVAELVGTPKPPFVVIFFAEIESYRNCKKKFENGFHPSSPHCFAVNF